MRRIALAGDALSHVTLPGIGVALALQIHPIFGAAAMLFFGALLVWALEQRARLATETTIDVVFSAAIAIGSMTTSGEDLIEALFGGAGALTWPEFLFGAAAAIAVIVFVCGEAKRLARDLTCMLITAVGVAVFATVVGSYLAARLDRETGPLIVTVATGCFLLRLLHRRS